MTERDSDRAARAGGLIVVDDVTVNYDGGAPVLIDVDLTVEPGDLIGIVGPSGSGKSTLLKAMLGTVKPVSGRIRRAPDVTVGLVPQVETIDWSFPVTVAECVGMARARGLRTPWITRGERSEIAEVLDRLGMDGLGKRHIRELSGGQQQRVFLARALFTQASVIFLDEPTSGLDVRTRHDVLHLLDDLNADGLTIVLTTHDLNGIAAHLPTVVCLNRSVIGAGRPDEVLVPDVLERTYGSPMEVLEHGGMRVVVDAPVDAKVTPDAALLDRRLGMSWAELIRPFEFEFFRNGLYVATIAGALCGLVGCYVVLRNMSYIGHGLSHSIFGGYAVAGLAGVNLFLGAGVWGVVTALAVGGIVRRRPIGSDAAIGVVTTASFALGLALVQLYGSPGRNADALLFGNVLGVTTSDVWLIVGVAFATALVVFAFYRQLLFTTFDTQVAAATGVRTAWIDALLMVVLSATVLATMNVMGVTLIAATLVVPAVVARMLTDSFGKMLGLSAAIGAASGFIGMNASYHLDVASGPTIVLTSASFFIVAYVFGGRFRRRAGTVAHAH